MLFFIKFVIDKLTVFLCFAYKLVLALFKLKANYIYPYSLAIPWCFKITKAKVFIISLFTIFIFSVF